jgi:hypothetical protein
MVPPEELYFYPHVIDRQLRQIRYMQVNVRLAARQPRRNLARLSMTPFSQIQQKHGEGYEKS